VATRLPDEEETPGPTILLPYVAEEERGHHVVPSQTDAVRLL
jgi:hypothetical protein